MSCGQHLSILEYHFDAVLINVHFGARFWVSVQVEDVHLINYSLQLRRLLSQMLVDRLDECLRKA